MYISRGSSWHFVSTMQINPLQLSIEMGIKIWTTTSLEDTFAAGRLTRITATTPLFKKTTEQF